jgi:hypothetical protein
MSKTDAVSEVVALLDVRVGQEYERAPMLMRDGRRWRVCGRPDHERIRIVSVPGGRRRAIRYVKIDPRPMGNGRPDRGEHTIDPRTLARHYALVTP